MLQLSSFCNIDCKYCYLDSKDRQRQNLMPVAVMTRAIESASRYPLLAKNFGVLLHAGEPLAAPKELFEKVAILVKQSFAGAPLLLVQTNATLIDQEWCDIFRRHNFRIGVSVDGPEALHDAKRVRRNGSGTFKDTLRGIELLRRNEINFNAICVVSSTNVQHPRTLYSFFKGLGCKVVGFSPEEVDGANPNSSLDEVAVESLDLFFEELFKSLREDESPLFFREARNIFDFLKVEHVGGRYLLDNQMNRPGRILSVLANGSISTYSPELASVGSRFIYGNINEVEFTDIFKSDALQSDDAEIRRGIQKCKAECEIFEFCGGGTPSSKFSEHGIFNDSFTNWCRRSRVSLVNGAFRGLGNDKEF